jgi:hypothetical protein
MLSVAGLAWTEQAPTSKTPAPAAVSGPRMEIEPEVHDFGKAKQELKLEKEFVIKNTGTADLTIGRISTSCGCTVAEPAEKVIKPGKSTTMKVTLETRRYSGSVERTVAISSNDPRRIKSIKVKAFVETTEVQP